MPNFVDLTGNRIEKLVILERAKENNKFNQVQWVCQCDCGKKRTYSGNELKCGRVKSCGCLHRFAPGESNFNEVIKSYKKRATRLGVEFDVNQEDFRKISQQCCSYCGCEPSNTRSRSNHNGDFVYNGIDRIDNSKGYVEGNVVTCCKVCNYAKRNQTLDEFKAWAIRLNEHLCKREQNDR